MVCVDSAGGKAGSQSVVFVSRMCLGKLWPERPPTGCFETRVGGERCTSRKSVIISSKNNGQCCSDHEVPRRAHKKKMLAL